MSSPDSEQVQGLDVQKLKRAALRTDLLDPGASEADRKFAERGISEINEQLQVQEEISKLQNALQEKLNVVLGQISQIKDLRVLWNWDAVSHGMTHPASGEAAMLKRIWSRVLAASQNELALDLRFPLELEEALRALEDEEKSVAQAGLVSLFNYNHNLRTVTVKLEKPWGYGDQKGPLTPQQRRSVDIDNEFTLDRKLTAFATGRREQIVRELAQAIATPVMSSTNFEEIAKELGMPLEKVQQFSDALNTADLGNISPRKLNEIFLQWMDVRYYFHRTFGSVKEKLGIIDFPEQGDHRGQIGDPTYDAVERLIANKVKNLSKPNATMPS